MLHNVSKKNRQQTINGIKPPQMAFLDAVFNAVVGVVFTAIFEEWRERASLMESASVSSDLRSGIDSYPRIFRVCLPPSELH